VSMIYIFFGVYAVTAIVFCFLLGSSDEKIERLERKQKLLEARGTDHWQNIFNNKKAQDEFIKQFKEELALIHSHLGVEKIVEESVEKYISGYILGDNGKCSTPVYGESYIKKTAKLKKKTNKLKR